MLRALLLLHTFISAAAFAPHATRRRRVARPTTTWAYDPANSQQVAYELSRWAALELEMSAPATATASSATGFGTGNDAASSAASSAAASAPATAPAPPAAKPLSARASGKQMLARACGSAALVRALLPYPSPATTSAVAAATTAKPRDVRQRAVRIRNALRATCGLRPSHVYFVFNKPPGCVSQRDEARTSETPKKGKAFDRVTTVYDVLPAGVPMVPHVGRLDKDTDGLLLFTDDGKLQAGLVNPNKHLGADAGEKVSKSYVVAATGANWTPADDAWRAAVTAADGAVPLASAADGGGGEGGGDGDGDGGGGGGGEGGAPAEEAPLTVWGAGYRTEGPPADHSKPRTASEQLESLRRPMLFHAESKQQLTVATKPAGVRLLGTGPGDLAGAPGLAAAAAAGEALVRLQFTLEEGRNRQIRRLCSRASLEVAVLRRVRLGPIHLGALPLGAVRALTAEELGECYRLGLPGADAVPRPFDLAPRPGAAAAVEMDEAAARRAIADVSAAAAAAAAAAPGGGLEGRARTMFLTDLSTVPLDVLLAVALDEDEADAIRAAAAAAQSAKRAREGEASESEAKKARAGGNEGVP